MFVSIVTKSKKLGKTALWLRDGARTVPTTTCLRSISTKTMRQWTKVAFPASAVPPSLAPAQAANRGRPEDPEALSLASPEPVLLLFARDRVFILSSSFFMLFSRVLLLSPVVVVACCDRASWAVLNKA
jgi:hypothetical protein